MSAYARPLRQTEAHYQQALAEVDGALRDRDAAIRKAHAAGMSTREIATYVSVSHQRVAQIVKP